MSGHAACAVGAKIYLFGGRQGSQVRKYLRRLYIYDTGAACCPVLATPYSVSQRGFIVGAWHVIWALAAVRSDPDYPTLHA